VCACAAGCGSQERGWPDINIITEKVAFQGITRFEDRSRLPLGSNFNVTSFSARILSQAVYNPRVRTRTEAAPASKLLWRFLLGFAKSCLLA
jgi:hypothetical protein